MRVYARFFVLAIATLGGSGCEHMCLNYVDCEAQVHELQMEIAALKRDNGQLRLFAAELADGKCYER